MLAKPATLWFIKVDLDTTSRYVTKMSSHNRRVSLVKSQHHVINPTNLRRALDDRIENRLHICWRAADDAENLGRRGLMLQSFEQFCVALLDFFEQAHVFNGDHGLVRERLEESNLFVRKRPDFHTANAYYPDWYTLA